MLWKKNPGGPKIGNVSPENNTVVNKQFIANVAVTLMVWFALLLSGGVVPVLAESLPEEPEFGAATETEIVQVEEPEFGAVTEMEFFEPILLSNGMTVWMGNRDNIAYLRCAKLEGFSNQQNCALDALGMSQEEIDGAVEEYIKAMEDGKILWE